MNLSGDEVIEISEFLSRNDKLKILLVCKNWNEVKKKKKKKFFYTFYEGTRNSSILEIYCVKFSK